MFRRRLGFAALWLVATGCPGEGVVVDPQPPPTVASVSITPKSVTTQPGATFQLQLMARDSAGNMVDAAVLGPDAVQWHSSDVSVAAVQPGGSQATVTTNAPGSADVFAVVTVVAGGNSGVQATYEGLAVATIHTEVVGGSPPPLDRVLPEDVSPEAAAVVVRGRESSGPDFQWVGAATGPVELLTNVVPRSDGVAEANVFAKGRSAFARGLDDMPPAWTSGLDVVDADPLESLEAGDRSLYVRVGLPPNDTLTDDWAKDMVLEAQELFEANRVGIELFYGGSFTHTRVDPATGQALAVISTKSACEAINDALGSEDPVEDAVTLYVLLVPSVNTTGRGVACLPLPVSVDDWLARGVFLSQSNFSVSTPGHEIAHVLGHWYPYLDFGVGHVDALVGFEKTNLMWAGVTLGDAELRDHLTLGQIYRMNFDEGSWLNARVVEPDYHWVRDCQPTSGPGRCPALVLDLDE
jgi:hypothetical protein